MNIYEKLNEARKIIREKKVEKDATNEFSKYDYFTPEAVEKLVSEACEKVKIVCLCNLKKDELGYYQTLDLVDTERKDGPLGSSLDLLHFELRTDKPEIKATNVTQQMGGMDTYSERYIKMKVFCIKDNGLDFDSQDNRQNSTDGKADSKKKTVADIDEF
jgi:hypothetical protein